MAMHHDKFKRFKACMYAIQERVEFYHGENQIQLQQDIAEIASRKEFQSRGKGGGYYPKCALGTAASQHRAIGRSKYEPHQGRRECERRLA